MLVLSRRVGESIVIDGRIVVQVLEVNGERARIGIEAPADVDVHRQEIAVQIAAGIATCGDVPCKD